MGPFVMDCAPLTAHNFLHHWRIILRLSSSKNKWLFPPERTQKPHLSFIHSLQSSIHNLLVGKDQELIEKTDQISLIET